MLLRDCISYVGAWAWCIPGDPSAEFIVTPCLDISFGLRSAPETPNDFVLLLRFVAVMAKSINVFLVFSWVRTITAGLATGVGRRGYT